MSQAGDVSSTSGPIPPSVANNYVTDVRDNTTSGPGSAVPAANVLQILGRDTNQNNDNGIRTDADPNAGNIIYVELTNRITGTATTTDATPTTIISLSLGTDPGVYYVTGDVVAFDVTDTAGAAYSYSGAARTDGATATEIAVEAKDTFEEAAMTTADITLGCTGNTAFLSVTGIAAKTIRWSALFTYRFVG